MSNSQFTVSLLLCVASPLLMAVDMRQIELIICKYSHVTLNNTVYISLFPNKQLHT